MRLLQGRVTDAPENLAKRDFAAGLPNSLWLTDITEFAIPAGKAHLSPVPDCFDGALPAWSIPPAPDEGPSDSMLEKACAGLAPDEHPVIHSDRGCHHGWPGRIAICERNGLIRSMSAKGCSPDNSAMEGFFGRPENESFHGRGWSGVGLSEFIEMLDAYLRYYNEARPKEQLGWMSPMQYRRSLGLAA
ncbi:DDE-type integrase/transposase/recombinase [Olsenella profusa]|uniref:DDE-type integrase/transposase/recombinase n=1 Tax=Olsenella profusa TaxID=138595 RepID=UPI003520CDF0